MIRLPVHIGVVAGRVEERAQSGAQSGAQSAQILIALLNEPLSMNDLVMALGRKTKTGALKRAVNELLAGGFIEYTIPDKPSSRLQKYQLTDKGRRSYGNIGGLEDD